MNSRSARIACVALVMLLAFAGLVSANGQGEGAATGGESMAMEDFTGTLTMWTGNVDPGLDSLVELFNSEHDQFSIEISVVPFRDYAQKVIASSRTGELPDIFDLQPRQPAAWGELGYLTPVTSIVEDLGRENFSEQDLYHNTLNGEVWGVPFFTIPHVLFYRTDLLEEAGFDGPPTTWDEFQDVAETLTSGDRYGYVGFMNDPSVGHLLHQWMAARGAETFGPDLELTIDSPETRDTLEFLAGLHQDGYMYEGSISYGMGDARVFFVNDRAAMISTSTSFARVFSGEPIQENIAAAPLPKNGGTDNYYAMRSLGISSDPQSLEAAEYVLEWIYQADNYLQYFSFPEAKLGFLPSYNVIVEDESFWSLPEVSDLRPIFEPALEAASQGWYPGMKYQVNQFVALFDAQNIYQDMLLRVIVDDWEVEQASEWAAEQMQEIMDRQ